MKNNFNFANIIFTLLVCIMVFFIGFNGRSEYKEPLEFYRVYLDGKVIGVITSEQELLNMINNEQTEIMEKYGVNEVHLPNGLEIRKEVTYSGKVNSVREVYNKIIQSKTFTIKGYQVTIKDHEEIEDDKILYILNEKDFDKAVENVALAFINPKKYNDYMNNRQEEIVDEGEFIESIDIKQDITIKPTYISVDEQIFDNTEDLIRYLLFGTLETQKVYKIKAGDTIEKVAEKNKLNVEEFIIANPDIKSKDVLLYPGQQVNIALIDPVLDIAVVSERVEIQKVAYKTKYQYESNIAANSQIVKQEGIKGKSKVTFKVETINGVDASVVKTNTVVLSEPVTKVVIRGYGVGGTYVNSDGDWGWPTNSGYSITSGIGWRWGAYHAGIDIAGTGYGSPIYAAGDGTVIDGGYNSALGNFISIDHHNGYISRYLHMVRAKVSIGDKITKGQQIGYMGNTGDVWPRPTASTPTAGTHLHFEIWVGGKPYQDGQVINPLKLY